jgi:hypothetical protein
MTEEELKAAQAKLEADWKKLEDDQAAFSELLSRKAVAYQEKLAADGIQISIVEAVSDVLSGKAG